MFDVQHMGMYPVDAPPTPPLCLHLPDGSWRSGSWSMPTTNYSYTLSYSLNVLLLCNDSFCTHDIYFTCPSWRGILLCVSPEGFFPFFPCEKVIWEFLLMRCEVLGQGCRMCTDCKALLGKFVTCENGLYKINWTELNQMQVPFKKLT